MLILDIFGGYRLFDKWNTLIKNTESDFKQRKNVQEQNKTKQCAHADKKTKKKQECTSMQFLKI